MYTSFFCLRMYAEIYATYIYMRNRHLEPDLSNKWLIPNWAGGHMYIYIYIYVSSKMSNNLTGGGLIRSTGVVLVVLVLVFVVPG